MIYRIKGPSGPLHGELHLAGSKSISNRALIIRALCSDDFPIHRLANAQDTQTLQQLLKRADTIFDTGAAGTTYRFLTAYLSAQEGTQLLTGSERMKQRPIGVLVEALRSLGASIRYLEQEGYPPLEIGPPAGFGQINRLQIPASTSSQYISALLMLAPTLPRGLELELTGKIVSRPYIEMTLSLMDFFGASHRWSGQVIEVPPAAYRARPFTVEADWSAASYHYSLVALAPAADLTLHGLFTRSVQGDAVLPKMMEQFGVMSSFDEGQVRLRKTAEATVTDHFEWDFLTCPDLAQTMAVVCAAYGVSSRFTGLETLRIKETDRIEALHQELVKVGADFTAVDAEQQAYGTTGRISIDEELPLFRTYEDHRMAMAFAPLALFSAISFEDPMVVRKSYPNFWQDLQKLGFQVQEH